MAAAIRLTEIGNHGILEVSNVPLKTFYLPVSRKDIAVEDIGNIQIRLSSPGMRLCAFSRPGRCPEYFKGISFLEYSKSFHPPPLRGGGAWRLMPPPP